MQNTGDEIEGPKPSEAFIEEIQEDLDAAKKSRSEFWPLSDILSDPSVNKDAKFLDKFSELLEEVNETSMLSTPHKLALRAVNTRARSRLKDRIKRSPEKEKNDT